MAISTSSQSPVNADINVTPMADVMLVLLIIFMITAPLLASGFVATMPQGVNLITDAEDPDDVILGLDQEGAYYINTRPYTRTAAEAELTRIFAARTKDKILFVKAHQELKMEAIQEAIAMARRAGVRVIAAVTDQRLGTEPTVSTSRPGAN